LIQIRDGQVIRLIEQISEHYKTNISNRFIRPVLLQLSLDKPTWDNIEDLTEKYDQYRYHGYLLDELYRQIIAMTKFVYATRHEVAPNLRHRLNIGATGPDKVLRDMAVNNFASNLHFLADLVFDLYQKVVEIDTANAKDKRPVYQTMVDLADIPNQLLNG
jgi:hypothetical protein